ncbi:MAG: hypothetical protein EHM28_13100 [Spirochaetaceae bacterium]|nr:MAG: hypothetical protein EHM28_13100 [Spirochaetaceae bacterium]
MFRKKNMLLPRISIGFAIYTAVFFLALLPLQADMLIKGGLTHEKEAAIGQTYEGSLEIQNNGDKPAEVKVYQTDYFFYADGRVIYGEAGKLGRSNAHWITFSPKTAIVPPKETLAVRYTVKVPEDSSLAGTYWSMMMVEEVPETSPESTLAKPDRVGMGIRQVFRYGVQFMTHIGQTGARSIKFISTKLQKAGVAQHLELDVENSGQRMLRAEVYAELYDPKGTFMGKFEAEPLRLYPGTSGRFKIDLSKIPNDTYKALVVVDCGGSDIFGANLNLVIK